MMIRIVGGLVAGILVFMGTLLLVEMAAHGLAPARGSPTQLVIVALAYFLSAFLGGLVAARMAQRHWVAWVIALLVTAGAAYSIAVLPHPLWMQVASIVAPLLGGFAASRFAPARARVTSNAAL